MGADGPGFSVFVGRRNDVFENKDLFKRCTPRFFFNGEHKQWRRVAPEGWEPAA